MFYPGLPNWTTFSEARKIDPNITWIGFWFKNAKIPLVVLTIMLFAQWFVKNHVDCQYDQPTVETFPNGVTLVVYDEKTCRPTFD